MVYCVLSDANSADFSICGEILLKMAPEFANSKSVQYVILRLCKHVGMGSWAKEPMDRANPYKNKI